MKTLTFLTAFLMLHVALAINLSQLQPPAQPKYETCQILASGQDPDCLARNRALEDKYNQDLAAYQQSVALSAQTASTAQSTDATGTTQSTTALINEAQQKSSKGSALYGILSAGCYITAGVFATKAATCGAPGCQPPFIAAAVVFAGLGMMANNRSNKAADNANTMCTASQQLSNTSSCQNTSTTSGALTTDPTGTGTVSTYFDPATGACKVDQATCDQITSSLPPGTNIRDGLSGLSAFASGSKNAPFKINPDGTITTKDGKTFKPSDFASQESMIAAGIPPSVAGDIASDFKKMSSGLSATDAQASNDGKDSTDGALGNSGVDAGGGGVIKNAEAEANGAVNLAAKDVDGSGKDRKPASDSAEGLVRDFNGELIGASGDDIFKMMNRRYNLKAAQDSFLAP